MSWKKVKAIDDVVPSGLRWKSTMPPVLASALIGLCSPVETRTVSTSDWWDASYAWPWLGFSHTVKHSFPALDLMWLIRPPVFLLPMQSKKLKEREQRWGRARAPGLWASCPKREVYLPRTCRKFGERWMRAWDDDWRVHPFSTPKTK